MEHWELGSIPPLLGLEPTIATPTWNKQQSNTAAGAAANMFIFENYEKITLTYTDASVYNDPTDKNYGG